MSKLPYLIITLLFTLNIFSQEKFNEVEIFHNVEMWLDDNDTLKFEDFRIKSFGLDADEGLDLLLEIDESSSPDSLIRLN